MYLAQAFQTLYNLGLLDVIVPFIIFFTLIYATLDKSMILGEDSDRFNLIIALSISLLVVVPHATKSYPAGTDIVQIMNNAIPGIGLLLVAIIAIFILIGMFGGTPNWQESWAHGLIVILSLIFIIYIFGSAANWWNNSNFNLSNWIDPSTQVLLVVIFTFGLMIYFITGKDSNNENNNGNIMEDIGKLFKSR